MFNINHLLIASGHIVSLLVIGSFVFLESGIPVGFFLPGDTMLFSAGFFASQHLLSIEWLIVVVIVGKILGSAMGYELGDRAGRKLFNKPNSMFFRKDYLVQAEKFYEKHGGKAIAVGQFFPVVRTFSPIVAGIGKMNKLKFYFFNSLGAISWGGGVVILGYILGKKIPNIDKYLLPAVILATIITFGPALYHLLKVKEHRDRLLYPFRMNK